MVFNKEINITARDGKKTSWLGSLIVYTKHFIRARLFFPAPVPILPVLGLPFQKVLARVKFWSGTGKIWDGKVIYTVKFYPSRATFFGTRTIFIQAVPKIFLQWKWALINPVRHVITSPKEMCTEG